MNFETVTIVGFFLYHLGILIYAIVLFNNQEYRAKYGEREPQYFYLKAYVWGYGVIVFGAMAVFVVVGVLGGLYSIKLFKKKSDGQEGID